MIRNLIMLLTSVFVGGAMAVTFVWFSRRLKKIEQARWGDKRPPGLRNEIASLLKRRIRARKKTSA